jgi:hypothetical protein
MQISFLQRDAVTPWSPMAPVLLVWDEATITSIPPVGAAAQAGPLPFNPHVDVTS